MNKELIPFKREFWAKMRPPVRLKVFHATGNSHGDFEWSRIIVQSVRQVVFSITHSTIKDDIENE